MKTFLTILLTAVIAAGATWFIRGSISSPSTATVGERKPLYYQSPMHPWIKSDRPGRCTICGMELTPIYPGDKGFDESGHDNVVSLSDQQVKVINVQTAEAKVQPLTRTLQVAGVIDDNATRHRVLAAYVDGRVEKLHVNFMGAEVTEGQPLADFYSPTLLQAEREYRQLGGELRKNTGLRLRQFGLTAEQIADVADKPSEVLVSQILSPVTGTVVGQKVYEGQYVTTGQEMLEIADFSTMWFQFIAYEQDLPWIRIGQAVAVTTPSLPGKTFEGNIIFIDPNFDDATRSTKVRVELPNPIVDGRRELLHKLYAEGMVEVDAPAVLTVPRSAVIQTGPQAVVYVDQSGHAYQQVTVTLGRRGDELLEILSGLKPGDKVVTSGNLLMDGQAELNRSFGVTTDGLSPPAMAGELTPDQRDAIRKFLATADAMAASLAADDIASFNKSGEPAMSVTGHLAAALRTLDVPAEKLEELEGSSHFHGNDTIGEARSRYLRFTMAATEVLGPLRRMKDFPNMQIWQCPMVSKAVPNAADKGRWIQVGGRPIQNPFFGAEMLDCGEEIKP